ncbi:MAG: hypothetical protein ACK46Q_13170 [Hyphomonas sp.]
MWKLAITGAALTAAGAGKFSQTLAEAGRQAQLADFLAFRCGGVSPLPGTHGADSLMLAGLHCWGCYAMLGGAGLMAFAVWQGLRRATTAARAQLR